MTRRPSLTVTVLIATLAVAACGKEDVEKAQKNASDSIADANQALTDASAAVADLKNKADSLKTQAKDLQAGAEARLKDASGPLGAVIGGLTGAAKDAKTAGQWALLETRVGRYPADIKLFDDSVITPELKKLLGSDFATFESYMQVSGPLEKDRVLYVTGNKTHEGGDANAYLLIDTANRKLEVGLLTRGKLKVYASPGEAIYKPKDVETQIAHARQG
ncbi:hypothetical protein [Crenobacter cavernae]|uniref:Lipoprotein n=1 Tax=Crenobacter cavernae TaxID=2290923 RepID=A0ABY0F969_9NEIS|nr:hypothetical protein [Crenobacter cavernae]RXZ42029.1 hypothetical protein EBB06_13345 [Crenobacter cavernae]